MIRRINPRRVIPAQGPVYLPPPRSVPPLLDGTEHAATAWAGFALACVWVLCLLVL